jgi:RNA-directed DNA polymerase
MPWPIIRFLEHRIADKRILRLIAKWLKVGIIEGGRVTRSQVGAPQGAVISPILANAYLHYVYDLWVQRWRQTKANGDMIVVRFADDTIVGFEHEHEATVFLHDLQERPRAFELALHPDKTRLIRFGRHAAKQRASLGEGKPETFDFLGFTHFCTRSGKWGSFVNRAQDRQEAHASQAQGHHSGGYPRQRSSSDALAASASPKFRSSRWGRA